MRPDGGQSLQLGFQFNDTFISYYKQIEATFDLRCAAGSFKPYHHLNKIRDEIVRSKEWRAAGYSTEFLLKTAEELTNKLAEKLAMEKDKSVEVEHGRELC